MKFKSYKEGPLTGLLTLKIDGVRAHCKDGICVSRAGKPLHNLPALEDGIYEIFNHDWSTSVSMVRTHSGDPIDPDHCYMLSPKIDERLVLRALHNEEPPKPMEGIEGFVVHTDNVLYKVKRIETHDVEVTGYQRGTGKHTGRMGALLTPMGKVGTGFTDLERKQFTEEFIIGKIIEVSAMELTPDNKFRHPRFVRIRYDKRDI